VLRSLFHTGAGAGPSTPLIADGTVFAVGVNGQFHALDLRTGALRWSHDLVALFKLSDYNAFFEQERLVRRSVDVLPDESGSQESIARSEPW
jgi:outer membrane protein assembly factor BamB